MVGRLMYTITLNMNGSWRNSEYETLRDARAALIRYQSREGGVDVVAGLAAAFDELADPFTATLRGAAAARH
jgi:hypothetical protein